MLIIIHDILQEIVDCLRGESNIVSLDDLPDLIDILLEDYFELLSLISGLIYFILQYNSINNRDKETFLSDLEEILGFSTLINNVNFS